MNADAAGRYAERRRRVLDALGDRAVMVLPAAPELRIGRDIDVRYRPDADLLYLIGYTEPEAVAVIGPAGEESPFTLFVRPRDPKLELWTGARAGPEAARDAYGADAAYPIADLEQRLPALLARADDVLFRLGTGRDDVEALVTRILVRARTGRQRGGRGPRALIDPGAVIDPMRLIKDPAELAAIRRAAEITVQGFLEAAGAVRPGNGEWQVEAAIDAAFRRRGADGPAFPAIVAAGANATVLHYIENAARMRDSDLLLLDAGASVAHYNADCTRTLPVSGRFSTHQRALYDAVLAARDAAIAAARPGATVADVHRAALHQLLAGLVELGILSGDPAHLERDEDRYRPFFPHRTSHWLGLDVHDVGDYAVDGGPRVLQPGMVLTVEPALYIPPTHASAPEALKGAGIRIEDVVVVTADGNEVLTADLPAKAADVEEMVRTATGA